MIHESLGRRTETQASSERSFGFVFAAVFAIVALWPMWGGASVRWWAAAIAAGFASVAIIRPGVLRPANALWARFGALLHSIVSPIVLGFMFFIVITPLGLLMRVLGKNPLQLRYDRSLATYWIERQPADEQLSNMKDQF